MDVATKRFLSTKEVAELLGYTRRFLRRLVVRGDFPRASVRAGERGQRWRAGLVEDWLRAQERKGAVK